MVISAVRCQPKVAASTLMKAPCDLNSLSVTNVLDDICPINADWQEAIGVRMLTTKHFLLCF